jgi:L-aspartate oxidase
VHGANRLASNSLLEGLVFGNRITQKIKENKSLFSQKIDEEINIFIKKDIKNTTL